MTSKEYCRYIRTYSELEGLQAAHTVLYCASTTAQGVVMELRCEQQGRVRASAVLTPPGSFSRAMQLLRYLCENSIGPEQWLEVLDDVRQPYQKLDEDCEAAQIPDFAGRGSRICGICRF